MNTDELIARLSAEPLELRRRTVAHGLPVAILAGLTVAVLLYYAVLGPRPDLLEAESDPMVAAKTLLPLLLALTGIPLLLRRSRPGAPPGLAATLIWAVPAAIMLLFLLAFVTTPDGLKVSLLMGHSIPVCLPSIVALSLPTLVGLLQVLRRGAPERPGRCGMLAGLVAGGLATALYSTFCTEDSPLFYGTWYTLGIVIVAALGGALGARLLRW